MPDKIKIIGDDSNLLSDILPCAKRKKMKPDPEMIRGLQEGNDDTYGCFDDSEEDIFSGAEELLGSKGKREMKSVEKKGQKKATTTNWRQNSPPHNAKHRKDNSKVEIKFGL